MPNSILLQPDGGTASPVVVSTDEPTGGVAIPVYLYPTYPTDRGISGALPRPVVEITDADLVGNGGTYQLAANQFAVPMFIAPAEIVSEIGATPIAIYVVGNSPSGGCTGVAPTFVSAEVGNVDDTTVVVVFSEEVSASNFASGVTIKKNTVSQTINSATLQPDNKTVYYVLNSAVAFGDTVTWEYSEVGGNIVEAACNTEPLTDVSAQSVTNNVPAVNWWEAGGASGAEGAYNAIGSATLADSYINLATPGTHDAVPGVAPTLNSGWLFNGSTEYIDSTIVPTLDETWTMLVRYTYAGGGSFPSVAGQRQNAVAFPDFVIVVDNGASGTSDQTVFRNGNVTGYTTTPRLANGVAGIVGNKAYWNGVEIGTIVAGSVVTTRSIFIGAQHNELDSPSSFFPGTVQAIAIYNNTLTPSQVAAVSAAMAAL